MTVSIIGLGDSAKDWSKVPVDLSIGVNDCNRFGHDVDHLLIINFPRKFTPERMKHILSSKARVFTHTSAWRTHFPKCEVIRLSPFAGYFRRNHIYAAKTSPIAAISLAVKAGATDIILWGVQFTDHKTYRVGTKEGDNEIKKYVQLFQELKKQGINVYLGASGTAFDNHLPLWKHAH